MQQIGLESYRTPRLVVCAPKSLWTRTWKVKKAVKVASKNIIEKGEKVYHQGEGGLMNV